MRLALATTYYVSVITAMATTGLHPRAGGPAAVPKPDNCTVVNAIPNGKALFAHSKAGDTSGWKLSDEFNSTYWLSQAYYETTHSIKDNWNQCIEQCYGWGPAGTCKSAMVAYDVPIPLGWFGTPGGTLSQTACLLFKEYATPLDFVPAPSGQFCNETAASVYCRS